MNRKQLITVVGGEPFFFVGKIYSLVNIFLLKCRTIMKLIFLERVMPRLYSEYLFYGGLTHRKIFRAIWSSKKVWKSALFSNFGLWVPIVKYPKKCTFSCVFWNSNRSKKFSMRQTPISLVFRISPKSSSFQKNKFHDRATLQ